jgi:hypothetical protein
VPSLIEGDGVGGLWLVNNSLVQDMAILCGSIAD